MCIDFKKNFRNQSEAGIDLKKNLATQSESGKKIEVQEYYLNHEGISAIA